MMTILTIEPSRNGREPHPRRFSVSRARGATLITTIFASFILSMFVGSTVLYVTSTYSLSWSRNNSEAALLLAEAGVNREIQYIAKQLQTGQKPYAHNYQQLSGEPHPGFPITIEGMPGKAWVYTSRPGTTGNWLAKGPAEITCLAEVGGGEYSGAKGSWGPKVLKQLKVQVNLISIFGAFALFGLDSANNNEQPSIGLTGNAVVKIDGNVGTNGRIQGGSGAITYTRAYNFNSQYPFPGSSTQFQGGNVYERSEVLIMPTVTEMLANAAPTGTSNPWSWLETNNDNDKIRMFGSAKKLSYTGTTLAGFKKSQSALTNKNEMVRLDSLLLSRVSTIKASTGSFSDINEGPNETKALIFPPGDYYITEMDLNWMSGMELIIDNGGLTTPSGKNADAIPVRFWMNGSIKQDLVELPMRLSDENDLSTFRIYYGKDGGVFSFTRDSNYPLQDYRIAGCVYAVTSKLNPATGLPADSTLKGTQINFSGDASDPKKEAVLYGSLIADRVTFQGYCRVVFPSEGIDNETDPAMGVGYSGSCKNEPCYSG